MGQDLVDFCHQNHRPKESLSSQEAILCIFACGVHVPLTRLLILFSCDSGGVTLCLSSSNVIQGLCGVVKSTNCPLTCNQYVAIEALIIITMC